MATTMVPGTPDAMMYEQYKVDVPGSFHSTDFPLTAGEAIGLAAVAEKDYVHSSSHVNETSADGENGRHEQVAAPPALEVYRHTSDKGQKAQSRAIKPVQVKRLQRPESSHEDLNQGFQFGAAKPYPANKTTLAKQTRQAARTELTSTPTPAQGSAPVIPETQFTPQRTSSPKGRACMQHLTSSLSSAN